MRFDSDTVEQLGDRRLSVTVYPSSEKRTIAVKTYTSQGAFHIYQNCDTGNP